MSMVKKLTQDLGRRRAMQTMAVFAAGAAATAHWNRSYAQSKKVVRVWTTQLQPTQMPGKNYYKETFEKAHPGVELQWEQVSDDDAWAKLTAAFAGSNPPDLVQHLTPALCATVYDAGNTLPMDDVIKAVGENEWSPLVKTVFLDKGSYYGTFIGATAFSTMWYRKSKFAEAGVKPMTTWAESLDAMKKLTKAPVFGHPLTYKLGGMTDIVTWCLLNKAGGSTVDANLNPTLNTQAFVDTLEYLKAMRPYAPAGASTYSFGESLTAFVSGATATAWYTGRTLANVNAQNPSIADDFSAAPWPSKSPETEFHMSGPHTQFLCKGGKSTAEAKLVAAWQYKPDVYARFLHGAPGHLLPVTKQGMTNAEYLDHPLLKKYSAEVKVMLAEIDKSNLDVKERPNYKLNLKMGAIVGANTFSTAVQKVVIDNMSPKQAAQEAHDAAAKIMKG